MASKHETPGKQTVGRLTYPQVRDFLAVYNSGTKSKAASMPGHRGVRPPALGRSIRNFLAALGLEEEHVFVRAGHRWVPTPLARDLATDLRTISAAFASLQAKARLATNRSITVATYPAHLLWVGRAARAVPEIHVDLRVDDLHRERGGADMVQRLLDETLDVVIAPLELAEFFPCGDTQSVLATPTPLYECTLVAFDPSGVLNDVKTPAGEVPLDRLLRSPLLTSPPNSRSRQRLEDVAARTIIELDIVASCSNTEALLALAAAGLGVAVVPDDAIPPATYLDPVQLRPDPDCWVSIEAPPEEFRGWHAAWHRKLPDDVLDRTVKEQSIASFVRAAQAEAAKRSGEP